MIQIFLPFQLVLLLGHFSPFLLCHFEAILKWLAVVVAENSQYMQIYLGGVLTGDTADATCLLSSCTGRAVFTHSRIQGDCPHSCKKTNYAITPECGWLMLRVSQNNGKFGLAAHIIRPCSG